MKNGDFHSYVSLPEVSKKLGIVGFVPEDFWTHLGGGNWTSFGR